MPECRETVIHWFRRDLRLTDNTALHQAALESRRVVPVYIISPWRGGKHDWTGPARQELLGGCLKKLEEDIRRAGGRLIFRRGRAAVELARLVRELKAEAVYFNRSPDPGGLEIETAVVREIRRAGAAAVACQDTGLHEREEVMTGAGRPYRVFTPYRRNWETLPKPAVQAAVRKFHLPPAGTDSRDCPTLADWGMEGRAPGEMRIEPGEAAARKRLQCALREVIPGYAESRDFPGRRHSTSGLSADLRMGTLSVRQVYHAVAELAEEAGAGRAKSAALVRKSCEVFHSELAWRDFYLQLLHHFPEVLEHEFDPQWRGLPWSHDGEKLQRWKEGRTGFPLVDAGMRELLATGRMHNRLRMITAMFLTKDLRIDWRLGEQHFMQHLADGEIASNNGGWQWSAGTGADAAPYFRIQNPWTQTKTRDPEGTYIRRWVPELAQAPREILMNPPRESRKGPGMNGYPAPMVNHAEEREKTLKLFLAHKAKVHR